MGLHRRASFTPMRQVEGAGIRIREVLNDGRAEEVVLVNEGHVGQPMTGWSLASLRGVRVFHFEDGFVMEPGASVKIKSGDGVAHHPPAVLAWTDETVWNNRGDVALLFDCEGEEVARFAYPKARAERARRLPPHRLVAGENGSFRIEATRRTPPRNRLKVSNVGKTRV